MTVAGLFIAECAGAPMRTVAQCSVAPGLGLEDDRYRAGTGHWSDPRWADQEVTLIEAETADEVGLDASLLRRNIVTRGDRLDSLMGRDVRIGTGGVVLRFVRPCDPCNYLETLLGRPGLRAVLDGRGGVRAAVVSGGVIAVGDRLIADRFLGEPS